LTLRGRFSKWRKAKPAIAFAALCLVLTPPALADEAPTGIGFAQAEEGTWWCRDPDTVKALACAGQKCRAESGGQDCHPTRWCFPAGWSALLVVWLPEFHSTHVICGMPGREAASAALRAVCDAGVEFTRCDLVLFVDPDGNPIAVTDTSWPGPAGGTTAE
jgi:hypothetical protein